MDEETGLPASIEAAWGVRDRPGKGPKPGLSLERIVGAAVQVADAEGLNAVSMGRVAKELEVSTMALYRYVSAKNELLELMVDAAYGAPPTTRPSGDWREGLQQWAWDALDGMRRHPWVLQVPVSGPPITPNQIGWLERGLAALTGTGISDPEKLSTVLLLSGLVRNWASITTSLNLHSPDAAPLTFNYGTALKRLVDPYRFPAITAAIESGAIDDDYDDGDAEFVFGLARILDGIEMLIQAS